MAKTKRSNRVTPKKRPVERKTKTLELPVEAVGVNDGEVWVPKEKAAEMLGLSVRRVQEYCQRGLIQRRLLQQGTTRIGLLREVDVIALKNALATGKAVASHAAGHSALALPAPAAVPAVQVPEVFDRLARHLAELAERYNAPPALPAPVETPVPVIEAPRPWLTLDEAAVYSGLPSAYLKKAIVSGNLPALDVGRRRGGQWRIKRTDLDALDAPKGEAHGI